MLTVVYVVSRSVIARFSSKRMTLHVKARQKAYQMSATGGNLDDIEKTVDRAVVSDELVPWSVEFPNYKPTKHTDANVFGKVWADPDISVDKSIKLMFNAIDGRINRVSFCGPYNLNKDGLPMNPMGRTGMTGRGRLGRWGPNHAADPVVTRWKRDNGNVVVHASDRRPILQFVAITRRDTGELAIPGGMVEVGESVSETLWREFSEEALSLDSAGQEKMKAMLSEFFSNGVELYSGYVDDPRNTDNSWMETTVVNFHDETGQRIGRFNLQAGDDATTVRWADIDGSVKLYASHAEFIRRAAENHNAHW